MRLLAFTDTHENPQVLRRLRATVKAEKVDLCVCVGDFTVFGRSTQKMLRELNSLGAPVIMIHGNHEDEEEVAQAVGMFPNLRWVHLQVCDVQGVRFMGFGGGGFSRREPELEAFEQEHAAAFNERTIILCHAPPRETALDEVEPGWHVGNESLARLIKRRRPMLVLSGHIHEAFHTHDSLAGATLINPGPDGEIIDIE